MTLSETWFT